MQLNPNDRSVGRPHRAPAGLLAGCGPGGPPHEPSHQSLYVLYALSTSLSNLYTPTKLLLATILVTGLAASAQEKSGFEPRAISSYPARQTSDKVTIAVEAFEDSEKLKQAFGKSDPSKYGILPVLVLIANDSGSALQLDRMRVQFIAADQQAADPVPAEDVPRTGRVKPGAIHPRPGPIPGVGRGPRKPKEEGEIAERQFAAPIVAPGEKAYGFFYFRVPKGRIAGSKLYLTGIRNARTAQELLYFEIPLDKR